MNKIEISLNVSKDFDNRPAVKKVSDKLTVLNTFISGRKNADGTYGPSASWEVSVTGSTKVNVELKPGAKIDVIGFVAPREYTTKDGQKRTYSVIVANEINETVFQNQAQGQTAPAQSAVPAQTAAPAVAADVDDLPFV